MSPSSIRSVALASGSNGNSVYIETEDVRLLVDAGLSGRRLAARAAERGVDLARVDALLLTHDHGDHVCGAGVLHRRYGIPLFASRGTREAVRARLGRVANFGTFRAGDSLRFGKTEVHTVKTPHDGADGVAFVADSAGRRLGVLTDLGHPFAELLDLVPTLDAAYLEANYDPWMLEVGPYPSHLKDRIAGPGGHLSNEECASLAAGALGGRLRTLVLSHLSGENNEPETARQSAEHLSQRGLDVALAPRDGPSRWIVLA